MHTKKPPFELVASDIAGRMGMNIVELFSYAAQLRKKEFEETKEPLEPTDDYLESQCEDAGIEKISSQFDELNEFLNLLSKDKKS